MAGQRVLVPYIGVRVLSPELVKHCEESRIGLAIYAGK